MSSSVERYVSERIRAAPLALGPFPHLVVRNIFPEDFYQAMLGSFPPEEFLPSLEQDRGTQGYPERFTLGLQPKRLRRVPEPLRTFWTELAGWMLSERFLRGVMNKFRPYVSERFPGHKELSIRSEALLVSDRTGYSLGPHTDSQVKVISLLFYLPKDDSLAAHGTSLYVPLEEGFTCPGGPHYGFDQFRRVASVPFLPNTMLAFAKSETSFHGVETIREPGVRREMLLYDVRLRQMPAPAGNGPEMGSPGGAAAT